MYDPRLVSLIYQASYDSPALSTALQSLLSPLGGWDAFLGGYPKQVLIKPNMVAAVTRDRAATSDPELLRVIIRMCKDYGCSVRVGDAVVFGSVPSVAKSTGILQVCKDEGAQLVTLAHPQARQVEERTWEISSEIDWADLVINLPKLKGHRQLYYTGAVKNLFGFVVGKRKFLHHMILGNKGCRFGSMLLDVARIVAPQVSIIDGIISQAGNGPINGVPCPLGLLGAACNPLALDSAVVEFLGGDVEQIPYFRAAGRDAYWESFLTPEVIWQSDPELIDRDCFYFPAELDPIRFSLSRTLRSMGRTGLIRAGLMR